MLVRHSPTPLTLRALAMEEAAEGIAAAAGSVDSSGLEVTRGFLQDELTVAMREELVPVVVRHLNSSPVAFGLRTRAEPDTGSESGMDCDYAPQVRFAMLNFA